MRTHIFFTLAVLLTLTLPTWARRGQVTTFDKILIQDQVIDSIPFAAGTHVKILESQIGGGLGSRTIIANRPGGVIKVGALTFSGDQDVEFGYGRPYFQTAASNIGPTETHHSFVRPDRDGYTIKGALAQATRFGAVLLAGVNDPGYFPSEKARVSVACLEKSGIDHCFRSDSLNNYLPLHGIIAEDIELDGFPALKGDTVFFQADRHPASIFAASRYLQDQNRWEYHDRAIFVELMRHGILVKEKIYAVEVTFNRLHRPSVIVPSFNQRLFGLPLGEPNTLEREALVINPDGSYKISIRSGSVHVFERIPVGSYGNHFGDLFFNARGELIKASLGGAHVYGDLLLKPGVHLEFQNFHGVNYISKALLGGDYSRYAYEGPYNNEAMVFLLGATIDFNVKGLVVGISGKTTDSEGLKEEYRRTDRIIRFVR